MQQTKSFARFRARLATSVALISISISSLSASSALALEPQTAAYVCSRVTPATGFHDACQRAIRGGHFDTLAAGECDSYNDAGQTVTCLKTIRGRTFNHAAINACDRFRDPNVTTRCLSVIAGKSYTGAQVSRCDGKQEIESTLSCFRQAGAAGSPAAPALAPAPVPVAPAHPAAPTPVAPAPPAPTQPGPVQPAPPARPQTAHPPAQPTQPNAPAAPPAANAQASPSSPGPVMPPAPAPASAPAAPVPANANPAPSQGQNPAPADADKDKIKDKEADDQDPDLHHRPAPVATGAAPGSTVPLFQEVTPLTGVEISAPFTELFSKSRYIPEGQKQPSVKGTLKFADGTLIEDAEIAIRGNTSKHPDQCSFTKLSVRYTKQHSQSILAGTKKIKIGTHCGEHQSLGPEYARLRNEHEPVREALIYRILDLAGVVSLKSRVAQITYHDTSRASQAWLFPGGRTISRHGFFLEDESEGAARYGAKVLQKSEEKPAHPQFVDAADAHIPGESVALGVFAEALTDNADWFIQMNAYDHHSDWSRYYNWNINILQQSDGTVLMQVYDWDIAGWVTQGRQSNRFGVAMARLRADPRVTAADIKAAAESYLRAKQQVYEAIESAFTGEFQDANGKARALRYTNQFYVWLEHNWGRNGGH